jgi:hypothetical protein
MDKQVIKKTLSILNRAISSQAKVSFVDLEKLLKAQKEEVTFSFAFPGESGATFWISSRDEKIRMNLKIDDKSYSVGYKSYSMQALYEEYTELIKKVEENKLSFAPRVPKSFYQDLAKLHEGDLLNLNTRIQMYCDKIEGTKLTLKTVFDSSQQLSLDAFKKSEGVVFDLADERDVQYLYGKAYDYKTALGQIRIVSAKDDGATRLLRLEQKIERGSASVFYIGDDIQLHGTKSETGSVTWFDWDGKKLERSNIVRLLGWLSTASAKFDVKEYRKKGDPGKGWKELYPEQEDKAYMEEVLRAIHRKDFRSIPEIAGRYEEATGQMRTLSFTGWNENDKGDCTYSTIVFSEGHIYECSGMRKEVPIPMKVTEMSLDDFELFCAEHYKGQLIHYWQSVNMNYAKEIEKFPPSLQQGIRTRMVAKEVREDTRSISELTLSQNIEALIQSYKPIAKGPTKQSDGQHDL